MQDIKRTMKRFWKEIVVFALLTFIGFVIYFWRLEAVPSGFYVDEALHGYNAYSILKTGTDEYGKLFPIVFRFYGSYNAPLYVYFVAIPIKVFGLNPYAVRIVAAISGLLSIYVFYSFLKNFKISLIGGLFFAIVPWLIFQNRVGWEVSCAFFLFCLGSLFFYKALKDGKYMIPSAFFLSLSTYAAYTERFIAPMLIFLAVVVFKKSVFTKKNQKYILISLFILFITQIPNLLILKTPAFFPKSDLMASSAIMSQSEKLNVFPKVLGFILSFVREVGSQYINYYSPRSLFIANDLDMPEIAPFYVWMIVPYLIGLVYLWKKRKENYSKYILLLFIVAPIPASLTKDPLSAHRALPVILPIGLAMAFGIDQVFRWINKYRYSVLIKLFLTITLLMVSLAFFWRSYFVLFANEKAKDWSYGFDQLAAEIKRHSDTHYVVDDARIKLPYIELAFFMKVDPYDYQKNIDRAVKNFYYLNTPFDFYHKFENIETRSVVWEKDIYVDQILVGDAYTVSSQQAEEHFLTRVFEIDDSLHNPVFIGYKTNPKAKCASTPSKSVYCNK